MATLESTTVNPTVTASSVPLTDQIADAYYKTTAERSHHASRAYYERSAEGLRRVGDSATRTCAYFFGDQRHPQFVVPNAVEHFE